MSIQFLLKSGFVSLTGIVTFIDCFGYVARVEGESMQPALNPNRGSEDYVFLSRWAVKDLDIERGDIISVVSPKDPNQTLIKRIVAMQGDIVSTIGYKKPFVKIPEGHCWIEGDHTGNSLDSNTFGPVSLGLITARASHIVWPPSRWQSLPKDLPDKKRRPISLARLKSSNS